ncbi:MAG: GEVED domain-containing protein, partial [Sulfitobacter sp.]
MFKTLQNRVVRILCSSTAAIAALSAPALAETCSVSPTFVNWVTPGTIGGLNVDQSATLQWGSASTDISISGPSFISGAETSITRISEYDNARGTYTVNFNSPVIHDLNIFAGNVGRTGLQPLESGIVGDFNMTLSGGGTANNLFGTVTPLDNQGYFQIFGSDQEGITTTTLTGTGADGLPLDGKFWVHDPTFGGDSQAYGMIDLAYTAPTVVSGGSDTISQLTMRQVGIGVGPTLTLGVQARLRSCIDAADDDFSPTPIDSAAGGSTGSVLSGDALNGGSVDTTPILGNVDLAVVSEPTPAAGAITLASDTGEITVASGTTPGTYFVEYSLTDRTTDGAPTNTDTATATVVVAGGLSGTIIARDDDYTSTPVNALFGGSAGEVLTNDTVNDTPALFPSVTLEVLTEAVPANAGDPVPTLVTSGIDAGRVVVPAGVPAGVYTIDYLLCDAVNTSDCDSATATIAVFEGDGVDYGDAPVSYLLPTHGVSSTPSIYLGSVAPDTEFLPQSDGTATGDDVADTDDEEGVTFPILTQGLDVTLDVEVTGNGYLQAWLDFNGDGLFAATPVERMATDLRDDGTGADITAGDGVIQIDVTVPDDATTSLTFARFRFSSEAGLGTTSFAVDGEVEDYSLIIAAADLVDRGDAPASYGDPRHVVVPEIYLGAGLPDTETSPKFSANADGDDLSGSDDEDGIAIFPILEADTNVSLTVQTNETLSLANMALPSFLRLPGITNLQLWVDFNQNGVFDASEQVATNYRDGGTGDTDGVFNNQISLDIPVPADAVAGTTYARVRWSTTSVVSVDLSDGLNFDGEVEDYQVTVTNPNGPLTCSSTFYMVATEPATNLPALDALTISGSPGAYTLSHVDLPPDYTGNYLVTGWGYNELDGYIYGVGQSPRNLYQINASGAVRAVADISGLSLESPDTSSDILPNGVMLYMSGTNFGRYQLLDISDPANPVALGVVDTGQSTLYGRDIAYNPRDGLMYFIDSNRNIYAFDPLGGTPGATTINLVGNVPLPAGYFAIDMDSVWFDGSGFLYAFDNQSRQVFAVEVGSEGNRPASYDFIEVQGTVDNITYQGNDGA